jgi:hypothetical protein
MDTPTAIPVTLDTVQFPTPEPDLIKTLALPRTLLREKRRLLVQDVDWALITARGGREIRWSDAGCARLRALLGMSMGADTPGGEKTPPPASCAAPAGAEKGRELEVARHPWPGRPQIISCVGPGGSRQDSRTWVQVKVANSSTFVPGMRLRAEPAETWGPGIWRFLGPPEGQPGYPAVRYPRSVGRW